VERTFIHFPVSNCSEIKIKMLDWVDRFSIFCFLDNHHYQIKQHKYECILAAGAIKTIQAEAGNAFKQLKEFSSLQRDWLFGHLGYDLKNETEDVRSHNPDSVNFPDLFFFVPEIIIELSNEGLLIGSFNKDHRAIFDAICRSGINKPEVPGKKIRLQSKISESEYINTVKSLQQHILRGDCYEINFCQEFYATDVLLNPVQTYRRLSHTSPSPFAAFYKVDGRYLLSASPERYLCRVGKRLFSEPMKGTWERNTLDAVEDERNREKLYHSAKERSENVMVVDLVRNDLSKISKTGTVTVDELFGIYTFPQVHQMISTVSGEELPGIHWVDIIKATFPMGSMTGTPKKKVIELIEVYEKTKRGLYSGSVGYISPTGNFDFNVVIRSILYNSHNKYLSYQVGSGITFYSDAKKEYAECILKAAALNKVLLG
jgi:para-aminobenzoate synthetase component I